MCLNFQALIGSARSLDNDDLVIWIGSLGLGMALELDMHRHFGTQIGIDHIPPRMRGTMHVYVCNYRYTYVYAYVHIYNNIYTIYKIYNI